MEAVNRSRFFEALRDIAAEEMRRDFPAKHDICIIGARVGYDACRYFGVEAKPVVVRAVAYNRLWHHGIEELRLPQDDPAWGELFERGAWSVAIDENANSSGRYAGHVVLLARGEPSYLVDLTLGQFSRPDRQMWMPDTAVFEIPLDEFLDEQRPIIFGGSKDEHGESTAYVGYRLRRDGPNFYRTGDWRRRNPISARVIRRLRDRLA